MPDPIEDLQKFGSGGIMTTPLDPERVRSLGNQRRKRRQAGMIGAAAVAVLAVVTPVALLANRGDGTVAPSPPAPTATASSETSEVITYPEPGIEVITQADVAKLRGTSAGFKTFIGQVAEQLGVDGQSCPGAALGVTVEKYSSAGYAFGGVHACGGYAALWVDGESGWQEVLGGNEVFDCGALRYYDVPASFAGGCYDYKGDFGPVTANSLKLGMTAAQARATGATIPPGSAEECRAITPTGLTADPNRIDAFLSPTKGIVGIGARPGMRTPKGIGLGSTLAEVKTAYPAGALQNGYWVVPLSSTSEYEFGIEANQTVGEVMLASTNQDCFG